MNGFENQNCQNFCSLLTENHFQCLSWVTNIGSISSWNTVNPYPSPETESRVIAPTVLILFYYIKSLDNVIPNYVDAALFADDAFVWSADQDLNTANSKVQTALEKVLSLAQLRWSQMEANPVHQPSS